MHNHVAFLDEWGNNGLDFTKKGVSTHFIVVALTLPKERVPEAEEVLERVRRKHFQAGPMKSAGVGSNHGRRRAILAELLEAPFQIFALVVDKRQLIGEGLRYKGSFYKFLHGLADRELYRTFPNLELVADEHGSKSFMEGFIRYVQNRHIPNLFNQATFGFVNDQRSLLVQGADLVAGTLARCYDETVLTDERPIFIELLRPKLLTLRFWPDVFAPSLAQTALGAEKYHPVLAELSVNLANDFLNTKNAHLSPPELDQVTCLHYLVFLFRHIDPTRYISSLELMEHLKARKGKDISLHYFQTKVIAPLRDAGVLIASSARGYKLPASERDLYDFINHSHTIIAPMLSRVQKFRDRIRLATGGALDVLDREEYGTLRRLVE